MTTNKIRLPIAADQFYMDDEQKLLTQLKSFFSQISSSKPENIKQRPKIILTPHAGYQFSGSVAAAAYTHIQETDIERVFIIGCSHREYLFTASLASHHSWQTPLGSVNTDLSLIEQLASQPNWQINNQAHNQEHSLEVQLPFLQYALADWQLVPILLGQLDTDQLQAVAKDINQVFNEKSLVVISTDLSHYPPAKLAQEADQELIQSILDQDLEQFRQLAAEIDRSQNLQTRACGDQAVEVGLQLAENLDCSQTRLYQYQHSGQASGDMQQVVGYASLGFY